MPGLRQAVALVASLLHLADWPVRLFEFICDLNKSPSRDNGSRLLSHFATTRNGSRKGKKVSAEARQSMTSLSLIPAD